MRASPLLLMLVLLAGCASIFTDDKVDADNGVEVAAVTVEAPQVQAEVSLPIQTEVPPTKAPLAQLETPAVIPNAKEAAPPPSDALPSKGTLVDIILGAVDYVVYPAAPNWSVHEAVLGEDRVRVELKLNRLHVGGEGQALQVLRRRADEIARRGGYSGYRIERFEEMIESGWIAQKAANAELVFKR